MNILISLDELMDTRLGVLNAMNPHYPKHMLANDWHVRTSDREILERCNITVDQWGEAYGRRNVEVLKRCIMSNILTFMREQVFTDIINFPEMEEMNSKSTLYLNTYPYVLDKSTTASFAAAIRYQLPTIARLEVVSVAPKFITPTWLKSKEIYYFFNYDGFKWLNTHDETLLADPLTKIKMFLPAMEAINAEPVTEDIAEQFKDQNRFDLIGLMWGPYITLQFIPVKEFSLHGRVKGET